MSSAGGRPSWQAMASVGTSIVPPRHRPPPADAPDTSAVVTTPQVTASRHDFAVSLDLASGRSVNRTATSAHGDERTTVPVDTAEGGQVVRLAHLLRLNPPDGRSSHIEWQPEGHRRL